MNTSSNPYHARIAAIADQAQREALADVEMLQAIAKRNMQEAADAVLRLQLKVAETQRLVDQMTQEHGLAPLLHYAHSVLASQ